MLELAPAARLAPRSSPAEQAATGLARSLIDAIVGGDFEQLETLFAPDVRFRALIPASCREASTGAGARALLEGWFGETGSRALLGWAARLVGDRLVFGYRIELTEDGERFIVEQHAAAIVDGAVFRDIALVCSGFRRVNAASGAVQAPGVDAAPDDDLTQGHAVAPAARLDATGLSCATLTPAISAAVRRLGVGAVLEIVADDPDAEEGLRSWTRLTGNELVGAETGPGSSCTFSIRHTPRDGATGS